MNEFILWRSAVSALMAGCTLLILESAPTTTQTRKNSKRGSRLKP